MGIFEDSYKSLLQGVSQQVPQERLPGQLTAQDNMLSDVVTGLRRRPGSQMRWSINATSSVDKIAAWYTDISGVRVHVILNTQDGVVTLLDEGYAVLATLPVQSYLVASSARRIQAATVGDEFFLANLDQKPALGASATFLSPARRGFAYVKSGAFSKEFELQVRRTFPNGSAIVHTMSYTTPNGSQVDDAGQSTPEYIASRLEDLLITEAGSALNVYRDKSYLYIDTPGTTETLTVSTGSGTLYMAASKTNYVSLESDLPYRLPSQADEFIMRVGDIQLPKYYRYSASQAAWLETGDYTSPLSITNMPVSIRNSGGWGYSTATYEGRLAGDDETNPDPPFIQNGITGLASYQGRLVLLAGNRVSLGASNKPRRFYRSSIVSLLDADPIHVGSSANSSAAYEYAIPFNKDLVLFSQKYQAVMPAGNAAILPRTATVLPTSQYAGDTGAPPISLGRSLMYSAPFSSEYFGLLEMLPSQQTDSQYTSYEATSHIPKYMLGRARAAVSSTVSNLALFSPSGDKTSLVVHQYQWAGEEKVQQAWSTWRFKYEVAAVYFSNDVINVLFYRNGVIVGATIDPKAGAITLDSQHRPYADVYWYSTPVDGKVAIPSWLQTFDSTFADSVYSASGDLRGETMGFTRVGNDLVLGSSWGNTPAVVGYKYTSSFVPTPPMVEDRQGNRVGTNKLTVLRYYLSTKNSVAYKVLVTDTRHDSTQDPLDVPTLFFESPELELGKSPVADEASAIIPCRTEAKSTTMLVYTDNGGELNVTGLEFACRYHQKLGRL